MVKGNLAACQPMTGNLRVPASGLLRRFNLIGNFYENVPDTPARFQISLTNQETMQRNIRRPVGKGAARHVQGEIHLHSLLHHACFLVGQRGAVILHCLITGAGGTLRFTWDGAERQPDAQRMVKARDGRMVRELIYYRDEIIPEDSRNHILLSLHS